MTIPFKNLVQMWKAQIHKGSRKRIIRRIATFSVGLLLFFLLIYLSGIEDLRQLSQIKPLPLIGFFFSTLGIITCVALRWGILNNALGNEHTVKWHDYFHYFIVSRVLGFILPKDVADVGSRAFWLTQFHDVTLRQASASIVLDRLFDLLTSGTLLMAVLPFWLGWLDASVGYYLMVVAAIVVIVSLCFGHRALANIAAKIVRQLLVFAGRMPWIGKRIPKSLEVHRVERRALLFAYGFSVIKFIFTAIRLTLLGLALHPPIMPQTIILGTPLAQISYVFAFTPGGLGIFEAGWFAILKLGDAPEASISIFLIGQRVLTAFSVILLAVFSYIIYMLRQSHVH